MTARYTQRRGVFIDVSRAVVEQPLSLTCLSAGGGGSFLLVCCLVSSPCVFVRARPFKIQQIPESWCTKSRENSTARPDLGPRLTDSIAASGRSEKPTVSGALPRRQRPLRRVFQSPLSKRQPIGLGESTAQLGRYGYGLEQRRLTWVKSRLGQASLRHPSRALCFTA